MNCPECEREVYGGSCRCGWRAPLVESNREPKSSNLCATPGCDRIWTILGYCRECYLERKAAAEEPATNEAARTHIRNLRALLRGVGAPLPYDKQHRHA